MLSLPNISWTPRALETFETSRYFDSSHVSSGSTEFSLNFPGGLLIDILHGINQMGGTDGTDVVRRVSRASLCRQHVHPPGRG